jgi:hypothetical protein
MLFQIPKSTPVVSWRTIHLKYMLIRLAAELFKGSETCFESDIHGEFQNIF